MKIECRLGSVVTLPFLDHMDVHVCYVSVLRTKMGHATGDLAMLVIAVATALLFQLALQ
jgi:hypothetical protein